MNKSELEKKAAILCQGGEVMIDGYLVRAKIIGEGFYGCPRCDNFFRCTRNMEFLCAECDIFDDQIHKLVVI